MDQFPNLLIVDDSETNLLLLKRITQNIDVNLIAATSGYEALKKTGGIDLALAIIDVQMPEMNGYELAEKLNRVRSENKESKAGASAAKHNAPATTHRITSITEWADTNVVRED